MVGGEKIENGARWSQIDESGSIEHCRKNGREREVCARRKKGGDKSTGKKGGGGVTECNDKQQKRRAFSKEMRQWKGIQSGFKKTLGKRIGKKSSPRKSADVILGDGEDGVTIDNVETTEEGGKKRKRRSIKNGTAGTPAKTKKKRGGSLSWGWSQVRRTARWSTKGK